jgi:hypothetical protein
MHILMKTKSDDRSLSDHFLKMIVIDRSSRKVDRHSVILAVSLNIVEFPLEVKKIPVDQNREKERPAKHFKTK